MIKKLWGNYKMSRAEDIEDNKGFTLVELIVVLVILAILAAILVPALLGYIDKAKGQQGIIAGKNVLTAAQAVASEGYAKSNSKPRAYFLNNVPPFNEPGAGGIQYGNVMRIGDIADIQPNSGFFFRLKNPKIWINSESKNKNHEAWTVEQVIYWEGDYRNNPRTAYFDGENWNTDISLMDAIVEIRKSPDGQEIDFYRLYEDNNGNYYAYNYLNTSSGGVDAYMTLGGKNGKSKNFK